MAITLGANDLPALIKAGIVSKTYGLSDAGGFDPSFSISDGYGLDPTMGLDLSSGSGTYFPDTSSYDPSGYSVSGGYGLDPSGVDPSGLNIPTAPQAGQSSSGWARFLSGLGDFAKGIGPGLSAIGGIAGQQQKQAFDAQQEAKREAFDLQLQAMRERSAMAIAMASRQAPEFHSNAGEAKPLRFGAGAPGTQIDPLASYAELLRGLR
jgi:hypothetical protein